MAHSGILVPGILITTMVILLMAGIITGMVTITVTGMDIGQDIITAMEGMVTHTITIAMTEAAAIMVRAALRIPIRIPHLHQKPGMVVSQVKL